MSGEITVDGPTPQPRKRLTWRTWLAYAAAVAFVALGVFGPHLRGDVGPSDADKPRTLVESRDIWFEINDDGNVVVNDAADNSRVFLLEGDQHGFLRGMVRAFAHDRKVAGAGAEKPYRLEIFSDGRLTLTDLVTKRVIILNAFGPDNIAKFTMFFKSQESRAKEAMK
jgi:putative photosynthetic complex assembly protein